MIIERQRGGERNNFDFPALKDNASLDISAMVTGAFEKGIVKGLGNSVGVSFGSVVTEDSKFFPLDRQVPEHLYPDVAEFVRTHEASTELRNFIARIISVQVANLVKVVLESGHKAIEFHPADMITYANTTALPVYAFILKSPAGLFVQTETSFRLSTPEQEVFEAAAE